MPARQPFTALCRQAHRPSLAGRADLHVHSTCSDGTYSPTQVVDLARRSGLSAVALTDHDTLAGYAEALRAAAGSGLEVIPGVEITAESNGRELHLLAYFVRPDDAPLGEALARVRRDRAVRFEAMIERLRACGVSVDQQPHAPAAHALGRRHLAELLVRQGKAATIRQAFQRYLRDSGPAAVPKLQLPVEEALRLVRGAGGVAAWAHPSYDCTQESLAELAALGMAAVEAEYPDVRRSRIRQLREWAARLGLAVTGGSDCHGPGRRAVGTCTISANELDRLRALTRGV